MATPQLIGMKGNRVTRLPLMECVDKTHAINAAIRERNFAEAMKLRGRSFKESFRILRTLVRALPHEPQPGKRRLQSGGADGQRAGAGHEHSRARGSAASAWIAAIYAAASTTAFTA